MSASRHSDDIQGWRSGSRGSLLLLGGFLWISGGIYMMTGTWRKGTAACALASEVKDEMILLGRIYTTNRHMDQCAIHYLVAEIRAQDHQFYSQILQCAVQRFVPLKKPNNLASCFAWSPPPSTFAATTFRAGKVSLCRNDHIVTTTTNFRGLRRARLLAAFSPIIFSFILRGACSLPEPQPVNFGIPIPSRPRHTPSSALRPQRNRSLTIRRQSI